MELDRKAFHFDLDNESVKRFYTGKRNAWSDIQDFLESHSFEKPQYSGYESAENIVRSYQRAYGTIDEMMYKFPWFQKCVKAATFTEIGESYDVKEFLENGMQLSLPLRPDTRKELHFDLGMAALSENYGSIRPNAWRGAWTLIRIFMERNGFVHTQFSGYESKTVMAIDRAMGRHGGIATEISLVQGLPSSPHRSPRSANATMPSPISRVPVASSFRFPPIRLGLKSRITSVPKSVI